MRLLGKAAIVTGGSRGIGRAISVSLAEAGSDVCVNYLRHTNEAEKVVNEIRIMGRKAYAYKADISSQKEVEAMVTTAMESFGKVDILINNAGIVSKIAETVDVDIDDWRKVLNTNLTGSLYTTKAVIREMRKQKYGQIINISSITTRRLPTRRLAYTVSKAGLEALTIVVSKEEAKFGIRVNAVSPGMICTESGRIFRELRGKEEVDLAIKNTPMGRIGYPAEVAKVVVFLASDDASYITGQIIHVNGGERLG